MTVSEKSFMCGYNTVKNRKPKHIDENRLLSNYLRNLSLLS